MHTDPLDDEHFLADFLAARLDGTRFKHREHLRAAWLLLQRHPLEPAIGIACETIRRLATALGAASKFHHTRTEALMRLMVAGGATERGRGWVDFLDANPTLVNDARGLLARHYSEPLLDSIDARQRFVPPDRLPLPC